MSNEFEKTHKILDEKCSQHFIVVDNYENYHIFHYSCFH